MSSSLFSVGRLDRKFVYESSGNPNEQKLKYNDPSFVTFRILFDFEPIVSNDEVMQGLLLNESRDESAVSYLRRMGEIERANALKEFTWLLERITNDFPWFFKNLTGIDNLWKWGYLNADGSSTQSAPVDLTISCYETVDLRITALADLYRKATRDRRYFRDLLTLDKKRFNMTILVGEARNLRTFVDSNTTDWLNHVSTVAFRCLDCEFDFSGVAPASLDASEAPVQLSPSFGIKVHRVQETNSYLLLNYMLGEIKRDLVIKQGGSGAEINQGEDITNYRSLLAPFVRSYEGNYNQVLIDQSRNVSQNFLDRLTFTTGDRTSSLSYTDRERLNTQQLNGISKEAELSSISASLLRTSIQTADITENPSIIDFGRPTVDQDISESVDLTPANINAEGQKIEDAVANQIEFTKPKVETELSDFSFRKPNVETGLDENIGLTKPTVQGEILDSVTLTAPTVNTDQGSGVDFKAPVVQKDVDNNVGFIAPTVATTLDQNIQFERPTVETTIDQTITFGRPSVATGVDNNIAFVKPTVLDNVPNNIAFEKPKVEDDFGS
jgi:hypothetical protein